MEELLNTFRTLFSDPSKDEKLLIDKLTGLVTNIKWNPEEVTDLFDVLLKRFDWTTNDRSHLVSWLLKMLHCIEIHLITPSWKCQKSGKTLIQLVQDKTVTDEELKGYLADDREKQLDEILQEIREQKLNQVDDKLLDDVKDIVSSVCEALSSKTHVSQRRDLNKDLLKKDLLRLCQTVEKTHFRPRLTQMVSWCIMALSNTGRLIQVGTGEGKSCIVAMFAAFRAMRGQTVDIMSSSSVLAERDWKDWATFYKALNISVSCNTNKYDKDSKKCYECQVVYGTVEEFAGDWLRHSFQRENIFGQRTFQCAIVDEVDSLMLDKGLHVVYISSDMPALQHLNPLLAFIWATVNQYVKTDTHGIMGPKYPFHRVVLDQIKDKDIDQCTIFQMAEDTGILPKGLAKQLRNNQSLLNGKNKSVTANQLANFFKMVERRFPSCQFALRCMNNDGSVEEWNKSPQKESTEKPVSLLLMDGGLCRYIYSDLNCAVRAVEADTQHVLRFTPCELSQDNFSRHIYVPGFLSDLVRSKLKVWIENAFRAQEMTMDHEYIIEKHGVVPVDYSCTGVVENFRQWPDGLHQFLEMKHESKLSDMTAITNYMSNAGLLQKYGDQIFGISGTLGQQAETETLQKIYGGIKTCQIPSFKRRKLFEVEGVILHDEEKWIENICNVVTEQTHPTPCRTERAVLVICETINRAKVLHNALGDKVPNKRLYINNNMDNTEIFAKKLEAGQVIIATNLAGRGTDLQVSDRVKEAGGLFVVQTFLPKNARVEAQAFGRTARQGSPGSAQLIVCSSHLSELLQLLVLTTIHLSLVKSIFTRVRPLYQDFVMQLRLYQKRQDNEQTEQMPLTLSCILTENANLEMKLVKEIRDGSVAKELASYLECDIPKIKKKQELFSQYLNVLDEVYKENNNNPSDSYLSALNEYWGMWLLTDFNENDSIVDLKNKLTEDLKTARKKLRERKSPLSNPHHYTAFGNELRKHGRVAESIRMYTEAIQEDPCWAAIAYYNRAFAYLTQTDGRQGPDCIDRALEDLQNALKSAELHCEQIQATQRYFKQQQINNPSSDSITRFDNHMITRHSVLSFFKTNINEAIKKVDLARDRGRHVKVHESLVYFLVPPRHFLPLLLISPLSLSLVRSTDLLKIRQLISHPSFDIISELICLESLGLTHVYTLETFFSFGGFFSKIHRQIRHYISYIQHWCCKETVTPTNF